MPDNKSKKLELANVKIDVWIDDEDYDEVYNHVTHKVEEDNFFDQDIFEKELRKKFFNRFIIKPPLKLSVNSIPISNNNSKLWQPLFFNNIFCL